MTPPVRTLILVGIVVCSLAGCAQLGSDGGSATSTDRTDTEDATTEAEIAGSGDEDGDADGNESAESELGPEPEPGSAEGDNVTATFLAGEGNATVTLETAVTDDEHAEGLMYRESLPDHHGMVFVYPDEGERGFWMKNTLIPLDMIFVASNGTVLNVEHAHTQPNASDDELERYYSDGPAQYVIELERGYANRTGVEAGTEVVFHEDPHERGGNGTDANAALAGAGDGALPAVAAAVGGQAPDSSGAPVRGPLAP